MNQILEAAPIPLQKIDAPSQSSPADEVIDADARQFERTSGYQAAVESTYWYMFAMLVLGLYAAFWIFVMAQNSP